MVGIEISIFLFLNFRVFRLKKLEPFFNASSSSRHGTAVCKAFAWNLFYGCFLPPFFALPYLPFHLPFRWVLVTIPNAIIPNAIMLNAAIQKVLLTMLHSACSELAGGVLTCKFKFSKLWLHSWRRLFRQLDDHAYFIKNDHFSMLQVSLLKNRWLGGVSKCVLCGWGSILGVDFLLPVFFFYTVFSMDLGLFVLLSMCIVQSRMFESE